MATMSRQHFNLIAQQVSQTAEILSLSPHDRRVVAEEWADALSRTNPYFNHNRFLTACGVE